MASLHELIVTAEAGFACSKSKLVPEGVRHLRPFNIGNNLDLDLTEVYCIPTMEAPAGKVGLRAGDLLFNNTNSAELVGKVAYVPNNLDAGFSNHLTRIRLDENKVEPAFVAAYLHWLWREDFFKRNCTQWVSQAAINGEALRRVHVPVPPLSEQRRIVDILNHAASIRRLRCEAQEKARQVIPALFVEMFGDPTNPGWPKQSLGELLAGIDGGWSPVCAEGAPEGDGWGVLKLSAVTSGSYDDTNCKALPVGTAPRPQLEVHPGDVLFSRKNTRELVGACAFVRRTRPHLMLPDLMFRLRPAKTGKLLPEYLWGVLSHPAQRRQVQSLASGSAGSMPNIPKGRLRTVMIGVPPVRLQRAFADRVSDLQSIITQQDRMAAASEQMADALMAKVFNGTV